MQPPVRRGPARPRSHSSRRSFHLEVVEPLEQRLPLAVTFGMLPWRITGDTTPGLVDDTIVVERDPANAAWLRAVVNGRVVASRREALFAHRCVRRCGKRRHPHRRARQHQALGAARGRARRRHAPRRLGPRQARRGRGRDTLYGGDGNDSLMATHATTSHRRPGRRHGSRATAAGHAPRRRAAIRSSAAPASTGSAATRGPPRRARPG